MSVQVTYLFTKLTAKLIRDVPLNDAVKMMRGEAEYAD